MKTHLLNHFQALNYGDQTAERIYIHLLDKAQPNEQNVLTVTTSTGELKDALDIPLTTIGHLLRMLALANQIIETRDPKERHSRTITFTTDPTTWLDYKAARQRAWQQSVRDAHAALATARANNTPKANFERLPPIPSARASEALTVIIGFHTTPKALRLPALNTFERLTGWPRKTISKHLRHLEDAGHIHCLRRGSGRRESAYAAAENFHTTFPRRFHDLDAYIAHARLAGANHNDA